jgi:hypothetical protein
MRWITWSVIIFARPHAEEVGLALFDKEGGPSLILEQHIEVGRCRLTLSNPN